jgi:hypothetical protein
MTGSTFPASWPHEDPDAVTGYVPGPGGTFVPDLDEVAALPAAAGLWTTAADLIAFGTGWSCLLPGDLAAERAPVAGLRNGRTRLASRHVDRFRLREGQRPWRVPAMVRHCRSRGLLAGRRAGPAPLP